MFNKDDITKCFPMDSYRKGQKETIEKIIDAFNSGKKFVILEAPTGSGKSVIGKTIANMVPSTCYITSQIMLQEQLISEFGANGKYQVGPPMIHLKGRSNYNCVYPDICNLPIAKRAQLKAKKMSCANGPCKQDNKSMCNECRIDPNKVLDNIQKDISNPDYTPTGLEAASIQRVIELEDETMDIRALKANLCPYWQRVGEFLDARIGLMNFKSFLFQCAFSGYFEKFHTNLMIVDEAHNQEKELLDFVGMTFTDKLMIEALGIKMPTLKSAAEYAEWFKKNGIAKRFFNEVAIARSQERMKDAQEYDNLAEKINYFVASDHDRWVTKVDNSGRHKKVEIKPIYVRNEAQQWLYDRADKVLMMSATILSAQVMCDSLGISQDDVEFIQLPNYFPIENREIHFMPAGSMSWKNKAKTLPLMLKQIEEIVNIHDGQKGIIHTHNFQIANFIVENGSAELRARLIYQKNFESKDIMLQAHEDSDDGIIIAPAMHEGLDLKDELSRFQILCKMPYPNFKEDPQLEARMKLSQGYYDWLVCLKLIQSYGRSIRSDKDYANTYILDEDFSRLYSKAGHLLPGWFKEAIVK